jgi:hypothetical protein
MALRIAGKKPENRVEQSAPELEASMTEDIPVEEAPQELPVEDPSAMPEDPATAQGQGMVDPTIAVYRTPDMGPFMCGNCQYYNADGSNSCHLVAGDIDPMGVCNLFTALPQDQEQEQMPEEMPMEEGQPPVEELPTEEPPPVA